MNDIANKVDVLVLQINSTDRDIIELTKAGYDTTQIAQKLSMTISTGGKRTDHEARSWVYKRQLKLGIRAKPRKNKKRRKMMRPDAPPPPSLIGAFFTNAPSEEERVGLDPSRKVHPFAFTVQQMVDAQMKTSSLSHAILNVASKHQPDAAQFMALIDQMMAWVPDKDKKGTGADVDFTAKAVKTMNSLHQNIGVAVERLLALQALLKEREGIKIIKEIKNEQDETCGDGASNGLS
jgi:hypothetical protein